MLKESDMPELHEAPYGSWRSPISTDLLVSGSVGLGGVGLDGADIYWTEGRPAEAGRVVLVQRARDGSTRDVTPAPFNVRSRVHEYGGGAYLVVDGTVYFSNFSDGRLYRIEPESPPAPLTMTEGMRYADPVFDSHFDR